MKKNRDNIRDKSGNFYAGQFDKVKNVSTPKNERDKNIPKLVSSLSSTDKFSLLDIGCGLGKVARCAKDLFPNASIYGVDISPDIVAKATGFCQEIVYRVSDELKLPFEDSFFDYATCRMSIHHYPKIQEHFREVSRVLKTNGIYLIMDIIPEDGEQDKCLNGVFFSAERETQGDGHVKYYTLKEYEGFFADYSFVLDKIVYSPFPVAWPKTTEYYRSILQNFQRMPSSFLQAISFEDSGEKLKYVMRMGNIFARATKKIT